MSAESLFGPIPTEAIRRARSRLALAGQSVEDWARQEGHKAKTVYEVLSGRRLCIRGESFRIAVKLGLRAHPDSPETLLPAGHTAAGDGPVAAGPRETTTFAGKGSCDRPAILQVAPGRGAAQLGEPVR